MCGIAGLLVEEGVSAHHERWLSAMCSVLSHRGPDDSGTYLGPDRRVALGHRRLSIIDLSSAGHQPMSAADGALWLTYNGEIYNYCELDAELKGRGYRYSSHSDAETILHAYEEWGEGCVERFNGMFAFALWDARHQRLFCARDRFGEKPFYYAGDGRHFAFASEIKALIEDASVARRPDHGVVARYVETGIVDADEHTFFESVRSLSPAHTLTIEGGQMRFRRYWSLPEVPEETHPTDRSSEELAELLRDSVRLRMRSDVPLGLCLSGGLDSSSIAVLAHDTGGEPLNTFSVVYPDAELSEGDHVATVGSALPVRLHVATPTGDDLFEVLEQIVWHNDEPSNSPGQYSQWHVMRLAREKGVTVLLNGQGGDELLGGYHRYVPTYLRELLLRGRWLRLVHEARADARLHHFPLGQRLKQVVFPLLPGAVRRWRRARADPGLLCRDFYPSGGRPEPSTFEGFHSLREHLGRDLLQLSVPSLVHSEDRTSMAFSREIRLPFLDHRLAELLWRVPSELKIRDGATKHLLRTTMARHGLPPSIVERHDKKGYPTPVARWLRSAAYDRARDTLASRALRERGVLDPKQVLRRLDEHRSCAADRTVELWRALNLEIWFRRVVDARPRSAAA